MPYKSEKQRRFFKLCEHSPSAAKKKCPDTGTLREFSTADKRKKSKLRDLTRSK